MYKMLNSYLYIDLSSILCIYLEERSLIFFLLAKKTSFRQDKFINILLRYLRQSILNIKYCKRNKSIIFLPEAPRGTKSKSLPNVEIAQRDSKVKM